MNDPAAEHVYETIKVRFQETICFLQIDRPEANNTINIQLTADCNDALSSCEEFATVIVLSGTPEVFCFGADFKAVGDASASEQRKSNRASGSSSSCSALFGFGISLRDFQFRVLRLRRRSG